MVAHGVWDSGEAFESHISDCGMDWRWNQPTLIRCVTWVQIPLPQLYGALVEWLRHSPFKAVMWVRTPHASWTVLDTLRSIK